jgi:hypothetical protein
MPSKSAKQANLMRAVAHNRDFSQKVGIPQSVGKEFAAADKKIRSSRQTKAKVNKPDTRKGNLDLPYAKLNGRSRS